MRRHYTIDDDEPHGTVALGEYYIKDMPDTRRRYGRRMLARVSRDCPRCNDADLLHGRLYRMRSRYRR